AVIDILQPGLRRAERWLPFHKRGHERPRVIITLDEHVHDFSANMDFAQNDFAVLVCQRFRFHVTFASTLRRLFPGRRRILYFQRDRFYAVTMLKDVIGNWMFRAERRG